MLFYRYFNLISILCFIIICNNEIMSIFEENDVDDYYKF